MREADRLMIVDELKSYIDTKFVELEIKLKESMTDPAFNQDIYFDGAPTYVTEHFMKLQKNEGK